MLHVIWGVYTIKSLGRGIYYSQSLDGTEWSEPRLLAGLEEGLGTQTPRIAEYKNSLIALYNISLKLIMRSSNDDGKTWSDPTVIFPRHVGVNGSLALVTDSTNELHLFFGQRISGSPDIHGMWHSRFIDNRWIEPEGIITGAKVSDLVGFNTFDPNEARAVVSQGNVILVTWRSDPGAKGNGVWFSYTKIDGPELPVIPLPTVMSNLAQAIPTESVQLNVPTSTNQPITGDQLGARPTVLSPGSVLAITLATVVLFLILFFGSVLWKRSS
jgi:hypothetical protein